MLRGIAKLGKAGNDDRIDIVADLYDPLSIKALHERTLVLVLDWCSTVMLKLFVIFLK